MILYRYESFLDFEEVIVVCSEYESFKDTPSGCWAVPVGEEIPEKPTHKNAKFIRQNVKRGFARDTREQAIKDFIERKKAQIKILNNKEMTAKSAILAAEKLLEKIQKGDSEC